MSRFMSIYTEVGWVTFALLLFFIFFVGLILQIFVFQKKDAFEGVSRLVFNEGESNE